MRPGGLCATYARRAGGRSTTLDDSEAYRFEIGGGHWIFGGTPSELDVFARCSPLRTYERRASIDLRDEGLRVPYPLQHHLHCLPQEMAKQAVAEIHSGGSAAATMKDWLTSHFGETLCRLFFHPFHESYTAGLYDRLQPQDPYKSPLDRSLVSRGTSSVTSAVGYNVRFAYPEGGLGVVMDRLAAGLPLRFGHRVARIDPSNRIVSFEHGAEIAYDTLLSTLPLHHLVDLASLDIAAPTDPYTSVLVVNLGGTRGRRCPNDHWVYVHPSRAGFHRVGFYSNVDEIFLPSSRRDAGTHVSLYVERALVGGDRCEGREREHYVAAVINELRQWEYIDEVEVVDTTWIDTAYTWSWVGSNWRQQALTALAARGIHSIGRYGHWVFQGIAESFSEGRRAGARFRR